MVKLALGTGIILSIAREEGIPSEEAVREIEQLLSLFFSEDKQPYNLGVFHDMKVVVISRLVYIGKNSVGKRTVDLNRDDKTFLRVCAE